MKLSGGERKADPSEGFYILAGFAESLLTFRGPLMAEIAGSGVPVTAVAPEIQPLVERALREGGIRPLSLSLDRTGRNPAADLAYAVRLYLALKTARPAYVLGYTVKPVIYGMLAARLAGVPNRFALVTGLGYAFTGERRGFTTYIVKILYRFGLASAHKVFFQNPDDARLFREERLVLSHVPSVVVNGSGVDVNVFNEAPLPVASEMTFLMMSRLLGDKGVREFAAAAECVKKLHPRVRFTLAGWIDSNPDAIAPTELNAWIDSGTIDFLGKLQDVRPTIAGCSVYVLPSYREGTPRTVLEAMAVGRAVITTDAPGCRETVIDGDNGFLVAVKSVDALVEAMLKFVDDPSIAIRMGKRSREIAEEKYDVRKVNAIMLREMGINAAGEEDAAYA